MRPWAESPESAKLSRAGAAQYPEWVQTLQEETGIDSQYQCCGLVMLDRKDAKASQKWCKTGGIACRRGTNALPWPIKGLRYPDHALFLPDIAQVHVARLLQALASSLPALGVEVQKGEEAKQLLIKAGRCQGVRTLRATLQAHRVVVTAGAWTRTLLPATKTPIDLEPVRGQMLCLRFPNRPFTPILLDGPRYLVPRQDGHVLLGSTIERTGLNHGTTRQARTALLEWAAQQWPDCRRGTVIWHRSGLRPARPDALPWYEEVPELDKVYLHTGHFRKGILQAPVTAEHLAAKILEQ